MTDTNTETIYRPYARPPTLTPNSDDLTWLQEGTDVPRALWLARETLTLATWHPVDGVRVRQCHQWRTAVHRATETLRRWADETPTGDPLNELVGAILRHVAGDWESAHVYRRAVGAALRAANRAGVIGNTRSPGIVSARDVARMLGVSNTQVEAILRDQRPRYSDDRL